MFSLWDQLVDCICRPPREEYRQDQLLGGKSGSFKTNKDGLKLQCSHFRLTDVAGADGKLPCVVYCHCNSGSRREAEEAVWLLLPQGITVFAFDFSGSGLSEGKWVTLGTNEVEDLECVVNHLRGSGTISTIALWGRSMGAVTSLIYSRRDPSIAGMVLDSPFSKLPDLMMEVVNDQKRIPRVFMRGALSLMRRSVRKRAGFDIYGISPLDCVSESFIPALFGHGNDDTFVRPHHSELLYNSYAGEKNLVHFPGEHNDYRPAFFYDSATIFLHHTLRMHLQQLVPVDQAESSSSSVLAALAQPLGQSTAESLRNLNHNRMPHGRSAAPWDLSDVSSTGASIAEAEVASMMANQDDASCPVPAAPHTSAASNHLPNPSGDTAADEENRSADGLLEHDAEMLKALLREEQMMLQQAIEMSLEERKASGGEEAAAAGCGDVAEPSAVPEDSTDSADASPPPPRHNHHTRPQTRQDEEDMLRRAIEESLQLSRSEPPSPEMAPVNLTSDGPETESQDPP